MKLKTFHVFNSYLPQTENWAYNLISNLPESQIHIAAKNYLKNNFYHQEFHFADNYFDEFDQLNRRLGKLSFSNILKKITIKAIPFLFGSVEQAFINYGRKNEIQLVHAHFANVGWEFRNIATKLNVPFVISFYGWDYEKLPYTQPIFQDHFKTLFKIADAFICEGHHGASILEKYGCPKEKIFVVRLGVQPVGIELVKRTKSQNSLKLVQIASFTEKKGHQYALEAVAKIIKECPNIELTIIGNDNEPMRREKVEQQITSLGLEQQVRILPPIDYKNLYKTLADYDVFIHPSCYAEDRDCEGGAPVVLLDAQATGMPVIATTHCDIPDEVIHEKTGLLSEEKNVELLSGNLKAFYKMNNEDYQRYAKNARNHVERNYDVSKNAIELRRIYDEILFKK